MGLDESTSEFQFSYRYLRVPENAQFGRDRRRDSDRSVALALASLLDVELFSGRQEQQSCPR